MIAVIDGAPQSRKSRDIDNDGFTDNINSGILKSDSSVYIQQLGLDPILPEV